jgi:hypothetical protein
MPQPAEIWSVDSEWGFRDGRLDCESAWTPVVLCAVGLRFGRRLVFWGDDPGLRAFFHEARGDEFVAHAATAEMKYLLRLGVRPPPRWFDTHAAWRYLTNRPGRPPSGLLDALHQLGLPHLAPAAKKDLQQSILHLRFDPDSAPERRRIADYCLSDCDGAAALYTRLAPKVPPALMSHWTEYLLAVARMELRGIPVDLPAWRRIQAGRPDILRALRQDVNRVWPVYRGGEVEDRKAFLAWCKQAGISWPVRISPATGLPYRPLDDDTLKEMEGRHPFIGLLRQTRKTARQLGQRSMTVDAARGRHYFETMPFASVTGRNQPKGFIFGGPKWMRWLIIPESPGHLIVNVDYVAQEIGVAAALSGDPALRAVYESSDCHIEFAVRAGAAPAGATKKSHPHIRKLYKTVNLGTLYGQSAYGASAALGLPHADASRLLEDHRRLFPVFWRWSDRMTQAAVDRRRISTPCGWRSRVPFNSNERTWLNWPMQSVGGDIMRATVTYLERQGVRLLAPIHDGFLLSCRRDQLDDLRAAVDYACGAATAHSLPDFPLRWELTAYTSRYEEEDGRGMWERLCEILGATTDGQETGEGPPDGRVGPVAAGRRRLPAADRAGLDLEGVPGPPVHLVPLRRGGGAHGGL